MRNLQILTRFEGILSDQIKSGEDTVTAVCIDEYGNQVFVYTMNHSLYAYQADTNEFKSLTLKG